MFQDSVVVLATDEDQAKRHGRAKADPGPPGQGEQRGWRPPDHEGAQPGGQDQAVSIGFVGNQSGPDPSPACFTLNGTVCTTTYSS